ncbi:MAG TPA: hypothetical protein DC047_02590 [Blastocatellia bacterium]|nr:hypothetical protein [Blastocatellia bacterium]
MWFAAFAESAVERREAISLAPRLQPGDNKTGIDDEPFLTVFVAEGSEETVRNGLGNHFVGLDHRAEATVLMRSLRVPLDWPFQWESDNNPN